MPFGGATFRAPAQLGWGNAMRFLLAAEEFGAAEALRIGLVQEVVPAEAHVHGPQTLRILSPSAAPSIAHTGAVIAVEQITRLLQPFQRAPLLGGSPTVKVLALACSIVNA